MRRIIESVEGLTDDSLQSVADMEQLVGKNLKIEASIEGNACACIKMYDVKISIGEDSILFADGEDSIKFYDFEIAEYTATQRKLVRLTATSKHFSSIRIVQA